MPFEKIEIIGFIILNLGITMIKILKNFFILLIYIKS